MSLHDEIPGSTLLDPEEIQGLKIKSISTRSELDRWELMNIQTGMQWAAKQKASKLATEKFQCELHKRLFNKVWNWAGLYRKSNKNIGVTWYSIPTEMRILEADLTFWIKHNTYSADEIAIRAHHRLVWIHPFSNGNGRHSRLVADLLLINLYQLPRFTWGLSLKVGTAELRKQYILALKEADNHNFSMLLKFAKS